MKNFETNILNTNSEAAHANGEEMSITEINIEAARAGRKDDHELANA